MGFFVLFGSFRKEKEMLVITRGASESIVIGDNIIITVVRIEQDRERVRLGIEAPPEVTVHRKEVYEAIKREELKRQIQEKEAEKKGREKKDRGFDPNFPGSFYEI